MDITESVKSVLGEALELRDQATGFDANTALFGGLPEFDSMAVVRVLLGLEEAFGIEVDSDDISAETFQTVGTLSDYVSEKLGQAEFKAAS